MIRHGKGSFLKAVLVLTGLILLLSHFDITLRTLISLDWTVGAGDLLIKFFTQ